MHHSTGTLLRPAVALAMAFMFAAPFAGAQLAQLDTQRAERARSPERACRAPFPGDEFARTELFFGLSRPGGQITEEEFKNFVDAFVTPSFPDGLTLLAGAGQFRDASGATNSEGAKLLILLYPRRDRGANDKIDKIRDEYKRMFQQQSVLRSDDLSCVSF